MTINLSVFRRHPAATTVATSGVTGSVRGKPATVARRASASAVVGKPAERLLLQLLVSEDAVVVVIIEPYDFCRG